MHGRFRVCQVGLHASPYLVENGDIRFIAGKELGPRLLPWQHRNGYHFVYYLAHIIGAKFEWDLFNISMYILVCDLSSL